MTDQPPVCPIHGTAVVHTNIGLACPACLDALVTQRGRPQPRPRPKERGRSRGGPRRN